MIYFYSFNADQTTSPVLSPTILQGKGRQAGRRARAQAPGRVISIQHPSLSLTTSAAEAGCEAGAAEGAQRRSPGRWKAGREWGGGRREAGIRPDPSAPRAGEGKLDRARAHATWHRQKLGPASWVSGQVSEAAAAAELKEKRQPTRSRSEGEIALPRGDWISLHHQRRETKTQIHRRGREGR